MKIEIFFLTRLFFLLDHRSLFFCQNQVSLGTAYIVQIDIIMLNKALVKYLLIIDILSNIKLIFSLMSKSARYCCWKFV